MEYKIRKYKLGHYHPKVNILILTYNDIEDTIKCINALYLYSTDFSLIIIDNGSSDETPKYLEEIANMHNNISVDFQEKNLGVVAGRNHAYSFLIENFPLSDFVMFLDVDQTVQEGWQEAYMKLINDGYDIIGAEAWKLDRNFYPFKKCSNPDEEFNYIGIGGLMIKNEVIEKIRLFDERYRMMYFEDPDFCFEADEAGYKIGWCPNYILHKPHQLLNAERRVYFQNNWKKFREKWRGKEIPILKMPQN